MKVDWVQAVTSKDSAGDTIVTFQVLFGNAGMAPVYVVGGCGGGLSASVVGSPTAIQQVSGGPLCDCAAAILTINEGQNHTSVTPGCWSGYSYRLVSPGTLLINMTLRWSIDPQNFAGTNSTSIQAVFVFD